MGKQVEIKQDTFSGGISDDIRDTSPDSYDITRHFDIYSNPKRLTPYPAYQADTNDGSTATGMKQYAVKDFWQGTGSALVYGLGKNGSSQTKIVYKTTTIASNWTLPASSEGNGAVQNGCFVEYKDYLWGFQGTTQVWKWGTLSGSPSITNTAGTVGTITSVAQGVIAKDDQLYLPYNNKLVRVSAAGTVTDAVLTLPSNLKITSICNYGNYLAIGCSPIYQLNGNSKVFLWNLTSADVQEAIDWGEGDLRVLDVVDGILVGVTDRLLNYGTISNSVGTLLVQMWSGGSPYVVKELYSDSSNGDIILTAKVVKNNRLFFYATIQNTLLGSVINSGIWCFGRKNSKYPYALTLAIVDENADSEGIQGFNNAGNFFFIAHSNDGSIDRTTANNTLQTSNHSFVSSLETNILNFGDVFSDKRLDSFEVSFRKITTGGGFTNTITAYYKIDGATSWTTIGSYSTVGGISHTFLNLEADNNAIFGSGKEFQFKITSQYAAEITGWKAKATILSNP